MIISAMVSGHFRENRQSVFLLTGLSDASGSMLGPAIMGWWLVNSATWHLTWRSGYFVGAAFMGGLVLWALFVRSQNMRGDQPDPNTRRVSFANTRDVLRNSAFYSAVALCFCHGLAQAGMTSFVGQLIKKLHVDAARGYLLSVEAPNSGGRLVLGRYWAAGRLRAEGDWSRAAAETAAFVATILSQLTWLGKYVSGRRFLYVGGRTFAEFYLEEGWRIGPPQRSREAGSETSERHLVRISSGCWELTSALSLPFSAPLFSGLLSAIGLFGIFERKAPMVSAECLKSLVPGSHF